MLGLFLGCSSVNVNLPYYRTASVGIVIRSSNFNLCNTFESSTMPVVKAFALEFPTAPPLPLVWKIKLNLIQEHNILPTVTQNWYNITTFSPFIYWCCLPQLWFLHSQKLPPTACFGNHFVFPADKLAHCCEKKWRLDICPWFFNAS